MENLIREAENVAGAFFALTKSIRETSVLSAKENEMVLIGILTAERAMRGLITHTKRALEHGSTKDEIISAILLALPVVGISRVNEAVDTALSVINEYEKATE